jgi:hypothetical protein
MTGSFTFLTNTKTEECASKAILMKHLIKYTKTEQA